MYQSWGKLLFMHWPVPAESLRPLIPEPLAIDTHDSVAWVGVTPFTMWGVRPAFAPALPFLSESHELNVRTYVHLDGVPRVWFFSLDANNPVAVLGARLAFYLPYFNARMSLERRDRTVHFASMRTHRRAAPAEFEATWTVGDRLGEAWPGSLDFFLIERYCLYTARKAGSIAPVSSTGPGRCTAHICSRGTRRCSSRRDYLRQEVSLCSTSRANL